MKRFLMVLAVLAIGTLSGAAQNIVTKEYNLGNVTKLIAHSEYFIEVTQGKSDKVTIVCDESYADRLVVTHFKDRLELNLESGKKKWGNKKAMEGIKVTMEMPSIEKIELEGKATLRANGKFKTGKLEIDLSGSTSVSGLQISGDELSIECSGSSKLTMAGDWDIIEADCSGASDLSINADADKFEGDFSGAVTAGIYGEHKNTEIESSGASKITIEGESKYLKAVVSGASSLKAEQFEVEEGYIELTGACNAKINCSGELTTKVSRMAKLTHYGNPTITDLNTEKK